MCKTALRGLIMALVLWLSGLAPAHATTPDEKQLFTVSGVEVDVSAGDVTAAKAKAIELAQTRAFQILAARLAGDTGAAALENLTPPEIGRLMAGLSVDSENTGPGRYIAKLNISFLPDKVRELFTARGVTLREVNDGGPVLLIPVWIKHGDDPVIWDDSPWRSALTAKLGAEGFRLPLGDTDDSAALGDPETATADSLAPLALRYGARAVAVLAAHETADGTLAVRFFAPGLNLNVTHSYPATETGLAQAADDAAVALAPAQAADSPATSPQPLAGGKPYLDVAMLFSGLDEWGSLRQTILSAEGVLSVDLLQVAPLGGKLRISYQGDIPALQAALLKQGLTLVDLGAGGGYALQRQ